MLANAGVFPVTVLNPEPQGGSIERSHVYRPQPPPCPLVLKSHYGKGRERPSYPYPYRDRFSSCIDSPIQWELGFFNLCEYKPDRRNHTCRRPPDRGKLSGSGYKPFSRWWAIGGNDFHVTEPQTCSPFRKALLANSTKISFLPMPQSGAMTPSASLSLRAWFRDMAEIPFPVSRSLSMDVLSTAPLQTDATGPVFSPP